MVGFEIFLDIVVSVALLWLVGEGRKAPHAPAVEVEAEATPELEAIATVPDVDLPNIGELFQAADAVGDAYLAPSEIEEREAALAAIAQAMRQVSSGMPPHRPGGGRRAYHERLLTRSRELQERAMVSDALLLTVATVATEGMRRRQ